MLKEKTEREEFIESNLNLVRSLCKRFTGKGIEYDDLYQAGCMGLIKAADNFDTERGLCFSTYAVPVVLGEMRRLFRDGGQVKVSRSLKELFLKVKSVGNKLELSLDREPTVNEIASELCVSVEEVTEALAANIPAVSLTSGEDDLSVMDIPESDKSEEIDNRLLLESAFGFLDETERNIIKYRYYEAKTQSVTAQILNISQVQVSRCEKRTLKKLREILK